MREAKVRPTPPDRLGRILGPERYEAFLQLADATREQFLGRTVWNISSTERGGGVAEMLRGLVATSLGLGVDTRWLVISGDSEFFRITKQIHNLLHGSGNDAPLGRQEQTHYETILHANRAMLERVVRSGDIVILHDPQTAGMTDMARARRAGVVWRCHVGTDIVSARTGAAWAFLKPYLGNANVLVFSRSQYVPECLQHHTIQIIPPAIDPFSTKNVQLEAPAARAILAAAGLLLPDASPAEPLFPLPNSTGRVTHHATVIREGEPLPADVPLAVQVSRWDHLKDMRGVLDAFADHVVGRPDTATAHLLLVGPDVSGVTDDPEGTLVLAECTQAWQRLPRHQRQHISLVSLPMQDVDENAALVNAVQRHASIIAQKSLVEGFGLTVAEAMWKGQAIVGSAVGGILDQITNGEDGILVEPLDYPGFGAAVRRLLSDPPEAHRLGQAARERARRQSLPDRQLTQWVAVLRDVAES